MGREQEDFFFFLKPNHIPSSYKIALRVSIFLQSIDYFSVVLPHSNNVLLWILLVVLARDF